MSGTKHNYSYVFTLSCLTLLILCTSQLFSAASPSRSVRFATYATPYLAADKNRDTTFNKYRRSLIASIAEKENWIVTFADNAAEGDIQALKSHDVDVLCSARKDPPPAIGYLSEKPLYIEYDVIVAREGDRRFINGDLASWDGAEVGYCGAVSSSLMTRFKGLCRAMGAAIHDRECRNAEQMEAALQNGEIDLCLMGVHDMPEGFKIVYNLGSSPIYFLCRDADIKVEIDQAMAALEKENPFFMLEMMKRVGGEGSLSAPNFNAREIAFVKHSRQTPCIVVTVHSKSEPFSDIDDAGNFTGLDLMFWQKLSLISGLQFHYIDADKYDRKENTDYLRIANANGWRTHADYKRYTPAIITRYERIYARPGYDVQSFLRGNADDKKEGNNIATLAMIREQRVILPFIDRWCKEYEVMLCDSLRDCLEKTSDGVADLAIIDESFLRSMHNINEYPRLASRKPLRISVPVSIEIKGPNTDLINSILNKTIYQIPFEYFNRENIDAETEMGYVPSRRTALSHTVAGTVIFLFLLGAGLLVCSMLISYRYKIRAETDEITGFPNLSKFQVMAQRMLDSNDMGIQSNNNKNIEQGKGITFILLSISVLNFRHLNNTFGFEWGRRLLRIIADYIKQSDSTSSMLVTHCYDDIFYCLVRSYDTERSTFILANNIANINDALVKAGFHVVIKSSAVYSHGKETIQSMMDKADYARESVSSEATSTKNLLPVSTAPNPSKGSNFAVFDDVLAEERDNENNIEQHIVSAFTENEIKALYQPKIDLRTGRLEGAEAFARWNSPELGIVMPNVFLPVFEKNGYALRLNFSMFSMVLSFLQSIIDRGDTPLPVSMNVTHLNIKSDTFARRFDNLFSRFSVPRALIEFELSERSLGMASNELRHLSALLHEGGFSVAIDDFGTGGSSLSMLGTVPADIIKFDQRLLSDSDTSNGSRIILTKLIEMSHQLGRKVVCKCVEKKSQVDFLRSISCDMVQGFYYSAPLPPEEFREYMDASI